MLQTAYIKENKALILERYQKRNFDGEAIIDQIIKLDDDRKATQQKLDAQFNMNNALFLYDINIIILIIMKR